MSTDRFVLENHVTLQPYWKAKPINIAYLEQEHHTRILSFHAHGEALESLPGVGYIGLIFSTDPQNQKAVCCGTIDAYKAVPLYGIEHGLLCHIMPGEFARIFNMSASELTNLELPLEDLLPVGTLIEEIACAPDFGARVNLVDQFLHKVCRRSRNRNSHQLSSQVIRSILMAHGDIRIKELEQQTGFSSRYLQNILINHVGLPPKLMCRHVRVQNALRLICRRYAMTLTEIAQACGYFDQSHFTREFKNYVGIGPGQFIEQMNQERLRPQSLIMN